MTDISLALPSRPAAGRMTLPALLLALTLLSAPAMAGDLAAEAEAEAAAPVILLDEEGNAVSTSGEGDLIVMPDGTMMVQETLVIEDVTPAEADAPAESKGGFPQLDVTTYSSQVFWLAIMFALLYVLMSRLALPRVTEVLDMRQTQINSNLDRAAQLNSEADSARQAFETILSDAQENARGAITAVEQKAAERQAADAARFAEHARGRVAAAEAGIAKAKTEALSSLADIAAEVAADMANKVGKLHISKADALPAVKSLINKA